MDAEKLAKLKIAETGDFVSRDRRRRVKWFLVLTLATITGVVLLARTGMLARVTEVRATVADWVYPSQVITEFNASGYIVAQRKASVASKGTGRIVFLGVQEGSRVKEGDIIARLDSEDIKAEKSQLESQLMASRFEVTRTETELATAEHNLKRFTRLWEMKAVSQLDFENAQDRFLKAKAAVDSAKANVKAIEASIRRSAVLIEYTIIRAPFNGVVLTKDADVGEVVAPFGSATNAKAAVVTMADLESLMVQADVAESFLNRVRLDQPCEIQLDAIPNTRFPGKVYMIVPTADRTRGTVMVKVRFDNLDPRVLPEMSSRVAFLSRPLHEQENQPVLGTHRDALVSKNADKGLFRIVTGQAEWVPVNDPKFLGDYLIVGPPVQNGDRVVLKPPAGLKSGDKVSVVE